MKNVKGTKQKQKNKDLLDIPLALEVQVDLDGQTDPTVEPKEVRLCYVSHCYTCKYS